ncbi:MipA/OmpV family protein [Cupriavidus basilensis]
MPTYPAPRRALLALALSLGTTATWAAPEMPDVPDVPVSTATTTSNWKISAGPGIYVAPKFPGARDSLIYPIIYQDIDYKGRFFSRGFDFLGIYAVNNDIWQVGADFQFDPTWRKSKDDSRLNGLGDVNMTVRARAFAQAQVSFVTFSADVAQDIAGQGQGLIANGDILFSLPAGKWLFTLGPGLTWTNSKYMQTFFGVTADQSARSGLPTHAVGAGLREWHANGIVSYEISRNWSALGSVTFARLQGDAASSPITERRQQWTGMAAVTYRFR